MLGTSALACLRQAMKSIPLIRVSAGRPFVQFLERIGAPVESRWARAGLAPRALERESFVPVHHLNRFLDDAARTEGILDLGAVVALDGELAASSEFQRRIERARSLSDAFATAQRLVRAHNSAAQYWVAHHGDAVRLCRRLSPPDIASRQNDLFTVCEMVELVRRVAGPTWCPREVGFQSAGDFALDRIEALADTRVSVGRPATWISLPRQFLSRALGERTSPDLARGASGFDSWLDAAPSAGLVGSLRVLVGSLLERGHFDVHTVADAARMSLRTFQRRLAEEGTSYAELVDDVRCAAARTMLEQGNRKLIEIAFELGYSDPAHFTRAFRRWTSFTPGEYRRAYRRGIGEERRSA